MQGDDINKGFFSVAAAHILGKKTGAKFRGSPGKVKAVRDALSASKALYEELNSKNPKLSRVTVLLESKKLASESFHEQLGFEWIL